MKGKDYDFRQQLRRIGSNMAHKFYIDTIIAKCNPDVGIFIFSMHSTYWSAKFKANRIRQNYMYNVICLIVPGSYAIIVFKRITVLQKGANLDL